MADLSLQIENQTGIITLTRPQALNALSFEMCAQIDSALHEWAENEQITQIIMRAEGEKSFCAGGDVAALYHLGKAAEIEQINAFWRAEYKMNSFIAHYPKPIIAMMQGYVMGGGVGIGCHASHRVIAESTRLAMPECAIGLIPDVGGSYLLARTNGHIGEYMALTGARIKPCDILETDFADIHIPQSQWEQLQRDIIRTNDLNLLRDAATPPEDQSQLQGQMDEINMLFGASDHLAFSQQLAQTDTPFAEQVRTAVTRGSPISMASIFTLIREVRAANHIDAALDWEYRFTSRAIEKADFLEGVRAVLVDKDHNPDWQIKTIDGVSAEQINALFAPASRH